MVTKSCRAVFFFLGPYQVQDDGSKFKLSSNTRKVGKNISTKEVGSEKRRDITDTYKHPEGELTC